GSPVVRQTERAVATGTFPPSVRAAVYRCHRPPTPGETIAHPDTNRASCAMPGADYRVLSCGYRGGPHTRHTETSVTVLKNRGVLHGVLLPDRRRLARPRCAAIVCHID